MFSGGAPWGGIWGYAPQVRHHVRPRVEHIECIAQSAGAYIERRAKALAHIEFANGKHIDGSGVCTSLSGVGNLIHRKRSPFPKGKAYRGGRRLV